MGKILIVEDTESLREVLSSVLATEGHKVTAAATAEEGLDHLQTGDFSLVLCDLKLPKMSGIEFLKESRQRPNAAPVLVMTAYGSIDLAVAAMKLGAVDFVTKPFDPPVLVKLVQQIILQNQETSLLLRSQSRRPRSLVTQDPRMEQVIQQARKVAAISSPVLLLGESGTGKELVARYIHDQSQRSNRPFMAVNCGALSPELLESEFFGHEPGSFTGATEQHIGLFESSHHGSIFLDEIGTMPADLQIKLLRTLQESEIKRVGGTASIRIDSRVISATNCDLEAAIERGAFRHDLYYRLAVVILEIPALRARRGDIPLLVSYFVKSFAQEFERPLPSVSDAAMRQLLNYDWPGNIRELENVVERAMIFNDGPLNEKDFVLGNHAAVADSSPTKPLPEITAEAVKKAEVEAIFRALAQTGGNKTHAAKMLGISYKTLLNKVKEYDLDGDEVSVDAGR
jgi:DNA-binding NtrC family response regulator